MDKCKNCDKKKEILYWNGTLKICSSDCAINYLFNELLKVKKELKKLKELNYKET